MRTDGRRVRDDFRLAVEHSRSGSGALLPQFNAPDSLFGRGNDYDSDQDLVTSRTFHSPLQGKSDAACPSRREHIHLQIDPPRHPSTNQLSPQPLLPSPKPLGRLRTASPLPSAPHPPSHPLPPRSSTFPPQRLLPLPDSTSIPLPPPRLPGSVNPPNKSRHRRGPTRQAETSCLSIERRRSGLRTSGEASEARPGGLGYDPGYGERDDASRHIRIARSGSRLPLAIVRPSGCT